MRDDLKKEGYDKEEEYFKRLEREQIEKMRKEREAEEDGK